MITAITRSNNLGPFLYKYRVTFQGASPTGIAPFLVKRVFVEKWS